MSVDTLNPASGTNGTNGIHAMGPPGVQQQQQVQETASVSNGNGSTMPAANDVGGDEDTVAENVGSEVNITINNTMCTFSVRCHLNLRDIALRGANVEFRKEYQVRDHFHSNWCRHRELPRSDLIPPCLHLLLAMSIGF